MKNDGKITLNECRTENDIPWDNDWLSSVSDG